MPSSSYITLVSLLAAVASASQKVARDSTLPTPTVPTVSGCSSFSSGVPQIAQQLVLVENQILNMTASLQDYNPSSGIEGALAIADSSVALQALLKTATTIADGITNPDDCDIDLITASIAQLVPYTSNLMDALLNEIPTLVSVNAELETIASQQVNELWSYSSGLEQVTLDKARDCADIDKVLPYIQEIDAVFQKGISSLSVAYPDGTPTVPISCPPVTSTPAPVSTTAVAPVTTSAAPSAPASSAPASAPASTAAASAPASSTPAPASSAPASAPASTAGASAPASSAPASAPASSAPASAPASSAGASAPASSAPASGSGSVAPPATSLAPTSSAAASGNGTHSSTITITVAQNSTITLPCQCTKTASSGEVCSGTHSGTTITVTVACPTGSASGSSAPVSTGAGAPPPSESTGVEQSNNAALLSIGSTVVLGAVAALLL